MDLAHLKQLLSQYGITQTDLARILGRDKSVITNLFQGRRQLKADEVALIARHIGVPMARILGELAPENALQEAPALIPFQHEPERCKKLPNVVKKEGKFFLETGKTTYSPKAYALEVRDGSMNLAGILEGDIVISEIDRPCRAGQVVIAQHYQSRGAKTIIRKYMPPFLVPHSTNASFKPLSLEGDDVRAVSPIIKLIRLLC